MTRRSGQIKARGPGRWLVSVYVGRDGSGKRTDKTRTVRGTKREAERVLREMLRRKDAGEPLEPTRITVGEYLDRWLEAAAGPRVRPRTFEGYRYLLARHVRPRLGRERLAAVTPLRLQEFYGALREAGCSADAIRKTHGVLRAAFRQAVRWRLLPASPTADVEVPKWRRRQMRALAPEEAERFRQAAAAHPEGLLFLFLLATGMRPEEALGLRWQDVDLEGARVRVVQVVERIPRPKGEAGPRWTFAEPKTAGSRRTVPLPRTLARLLAEHRRRQAAGRLRRGPYWQDHDLVFPGQLGQPLDWHNVSQRAFHAIRRAAGLAEGLRPYDLRHTTATLLLAAGESPKVVAERLGHSTTTLTLDTYAHVLPTMQERATERLEAMLFGKS